MCAVGHARLRAHVPDRHGTLRTDGAPARIRRDVRSARQPPPGAEAAPGKLAPLSPLLPAAPLLGVPDGAVDGAADMPPVALESELAPPLSLFFWQPAPAARPAIRRPAKTARDT
ncbi:hypothetical protein AAB988_25135 [Burkholderia contaminans]|uniref:hypothetical protein n=1 Tax=Burkholderia contaminans TaxID=488447 RepID=UPI003112F402